METVELTDIEHAEAKVRDATRALAASVTDETIAAARSARLTYETLKEIAGMCLHLGCRRRETAVGRCAAHPHSGPKRGLRP